MEEARKKEKERIEMLYAHIYICIFLNAIIYELNRLNAEGKELDERVSYGVSARTQFVHSVHKLNAELLLFLLLLIVILCIVYIYTIHLSVHYVI